MPGKMENAASYRYISALALLRTVAAVELSTQAAIEAITEEIKLGTVSGDNISIGHGNVLTLGVLFPAAVTNVTVKVFVSMKGNTAAHNHWAQVHTEDLTASGHITISNIYPANTKVVITTLTGVGSVEIVYGRTL